MINQSPENSLTPRIKVTLTRTGILDCRGKPLLQKLEQITLKDIEIDILRKFFTVLDYFLEKELCILKQMLNSRHCLSILTGADSNFIRFLCDCCVNVFLGHVPANKSFIESKKIPFGKIVDPKFSIREKRKVLVNNISLVKSIGESCYIYLKTRTSGMYAEEFILIPRKTYAPDKKKLHHNLKSFIIH